MCVFLSAWTSGWQTHSGCSINIWWGKKGARKEQWKGRESWRGGHTVIPILRRLRQEDVGSRPVGLHSETLSIPWKKKLSTISGVLFSTRFPLLKTETGRVREIRWERRNPAHCCSRKSLKTWHSEPWPLGLAPHCWVFAFVKELYFLCLSSPEWVNDLL
jgi:hypothetical protein